MPYGWIFKDEDVYIPAQSGQRLNCFAMIDRRCNTHSFCTTESMDAAKMVAFFDEYSFTVKKKTVVILDNAPIHRAKIFQERRKYWAARGLHIFFLPPYSPHLNIAEILWRQLKGKWLQPRDYISVDSLFYATNRILAAMGDGLFINFKNHAA